MEQDDDGTGCPVNNHWTARLFVDQHSTIRHDLPQKQCKPSKSTAKSFLLTTLRINLFIFNHLRDPHLNLSP